jgi:hypothetical protein
MIGRILTIPFRGGVSASSNRVLVSNRIDSPYRTKSFHIKFELNTQRTVRLRFFMGEDSDDTFANVERQNDLFRQLAQDSEFAGDDQDIDLQHEVQIPQRGTFLKVLAENDDLVDHFFDAQITIELLDTDAPPVNATP